VLSSWRKWLLAAPALYLLSFFGLTAAGIIGPDEARYASIGREMARSGDWVTPRLWGEPWFEKPPLLYWIIAAGNLAGLGPELAPRLPVALLSAAFLLVYYSLLRKEFGERAALFSTIILGTSAGWVAYSSVAVTDLPLSVSFSIAMLLGLRWLSTGDRRWAAGSAFFLGVAALAKGLVPLVLFVPLLWVGRKRWRDWVRPLPLAAFFLTAAPWYVLSTAWNGQAFLQEFFWKQQFTRFASGVQLHPQPFWFYIPVLVAGFFPWIPLWLPVCRPSLYRDARRRFLLLWAVFGLVFFSLSAGKLPGYLLPLFPAVAALAGLALDEMRDARWTLAACCLTLVVIPAVSGSLPDAMARGLSSTGITGWNWGVAIACILMAALVWRTVQAGRRETAMILLLLSTVTGIVYVKVTALPAMDGLLSARRVWGTVSGDPQQACVAEMGRNLRYSLNYYSVQPLPDCGQPSKPIRIRSLDGLPPFAE
jgi:4-amino-4-deoxy-L-arabinose transferase-like glycosyltransferase